VILALFSCHSKINPPFRNPKSLPSKVVAQFIGRLCLDESGNYKNPEGEKQEVRRAGIYSPPKPEGFSGLSACYYRLASEARLSRYHPIY